MCQPIKRGPGVASDSGSGNSLRNGFDELASFPAANPLQDPDRPPIAQHTGRCTSLRQVKEVLQAMPGFDRIGELLRPAKHGFDAVAVRLELTLSFLAHRKLPIVKGENEF